MNSQIHYFCIGHTKSSWSLPNQAIYVRTMKGFVGNDIHSDVIDIGDLSDELSFYYPFLGGTAGAFAILDIVRDGKRYCQPDDRIMIFQQAKLVVSKKIGWVSRNYPGMRLLNTINSVGVDIARVAGDENFLIPEPFRIKGGLMRQYAQHHYLPDFLKYLAVAIEEGVLNPKQVVDLCSSEIFIPGGGILGVFPIGYYLKTVELIKSVTYSYLNKNKPGLKSPYQRIAAAYSAERLGSYLLMEHFSSTFGGIPRKCIGTMVAVSDGEYVGGSSNQDLRK